MTVRHYTGFWLKDAITTAACAFVVAIGLSACSDSDNNTSSEPDASAPVQTESEANEAIGTVLNNLNQQLEQTSDQVQEAVAPHAAQIQARTKDEVEKLFKWEYRVVDLPATSTPSQMEHDLSQLGAEGWECVSILPVATGLRVSCKRKPPSALAYLKYIPGL